MSGSRFQILAATPEKAALIKSEGLISVGGDQSSGVALPGLKKRDDYAVISIGADEISVHPLTGYRGKQKGPLKLGAFETLVLDDLTLIVIESTSFQRDTQVNVESPALGKLIKEFSEFEDLARSMTAALETLVAEMEMEKGLIITRDLNGTFDVVARRGISTDEPWLSETLIQQTLSAQKPISIQNIFGSSFDSNKSLMATGFISVFTWPLVVRGETLGLILAGSLRPHSGLSAAQKQKAETLSQITALMLWFYLRDLKLKEEVEALRASQVDPGESPLLTSYQPLIEMISIAKKVAPTGLGVLIEGETGVGKELLANWIHKKSDRSRGPFVAVNCGAIPHDLLESTLFGHKKGAFTGAYADQTGKFQLADGGTLFLDEIGDLPEALQGKLLRALQERCIEPLGAPRAQKVDVRIIAATHKSVPQLIASGNFREDLYFRLAEMILTISPLRDRPHDIVLLATCFLKDLKSEKRFSTEAWNWLKRHDWKGNVRELLSSVKRAAVLSDGSEITISDLTRGLPSLRTEKAGPSRDWLGGKNLEEAKNFFIQEKVRQALAQSNGQRNKAAELLGVTPRTLFRYLEDRTKDGSETDVSL